MPLSIVRDDITHVRADALVNAANEQLRQGGGVCGALFEAAGARRLQRACDKIGHCDTGKAVATPAFALPARYVIHAVGPIWHGGTQGERALLASCYRTSLELADSLKCRSIAFPLISAGIYGYPPREALAVAQEEIRSFLADHEMDVTLVLFDSRVVRLADEVRLRVERFIDDVYVEASGSARRRPWENVTPSAARPDDTASLSQDVPAQCPRCGAPVPDDARFCFACGVDLTDPDAATRPYSYDYYLPDPVTYEAAPMAAPSAPAPPSGSARQQTQAAPSPKGRRRLGLPLSLRNRLTHMDAGFSETLLSLIDARGLTDAQVYKRANLSRQHFSKIRSNPGYHPTKTTVLALAIALELSLDETRLLLERAGFALSHADRRDVIVEFFIREGVYDVFDINDALFAFDQPLLG